MTTTEHHYGYLISVLGRIREVTGVGHKPMLSELPEAIAQVISDLKTQSAPQAVGRSAEVSRIRDEYVNRPSKYSYGKNDIGVLLGVITALEAQTQAPPSVLTCIDEQGKVSGHEVVGCSGGLDYVEGFPRLVMLQRLEGGEVVTYHHEATMPKAPASAVECAQDIFMYYAGATNPSLQEVARIITAHTSAAVAEAREKALEEAAQVESWYDGHGTIRYSHPSYNKTRSLAYSYGLLGEAIRALKGKEGVQ